ncbi:ATP-binding protein [Streptomyces pseudogriseolus]|uniref:ATP-binding protein n=1 Tax=Streptomyces pseudogriseolus TaxID=36817 RepID=UPI003FA1FA89
MPPRIAEPISVSEAPLVEAAGPARPSFSIVVPSAPSSVQVVRRVVRAWTRSHCQLPADQADALLVVLSEMCTNAVLHGHTDAFDVRAWVPATGELRLEVDDKTPSVSPTPGSPDTDAESGRGLLLVDALVRELGGTWGYSADGARAWCVLPALEAAR